MASQHNRLRMYSHDYWLETVANKLNEKTTFYCRKKHIVELATDVKKSNKCFAFSSNLTDVLSFLHSLKYTLITIRFMIKRDFLKSCIKPLILHQIHQNNVFGFVALEILSAILQNEDKYIYISDHKIIKSLFNMLYSPNNTDKKLNELIQKSQQICIEMQSKMDVEPNNDQTLCLESMPMDTFCYLLSFVPSSNLTTIQCVSYSFYSAIQKPATNIILNGDTLFNIMQAFSMDQSPNADNLGLYHYDINFFRKYTSIKQLSVSCYTLSNLMNHFNFPNAVTFFNQFHDIQQLQLKEIGHYINMDKHHAFDDLLQDLVTAKYLKHTVQSLIFQEHEQKIKMTVQTFQYFQEFSNLNSLEIDGYIMLNDELQDFEYMNEHYLEIQSFIKHITHISIGCDIFHESIIPSFFSLFFHPNIQSLFFRLTHAEIHGAFIDFMEEMDDLAENGKLLQGVQNLSNLQQFEIYIEPDLDIQYDEYDQSQLWMLSMINNMNHLQQFKVSQWNKLLMFGDIEINNINIDNNMLYKVVSNNINTLQSICFCHDAAHFSSLDTLNTDSWIPLFLLYNILINKNNFECIQYWMQNTFKEFQFCLMIDNLYRDECYEQFTNLKIYFFPKVKAIMRSLKKIFKKYDIEYSIKLEFDNWSKEDQHVYANQFKEATVTEKALIFEDNNQTLITDYFPFI